MSIKYKLKNIATKAGTKLLKVTRLSVHFDHSEGTWYIENLYIENQRRLFKGHRLVAKVWLNRSLRARLDKLS